MTAPRRTIRRSPVVLGLVAVVALVAIAGAAGLAYLFLRPGAPAAVGLATTPPGASAASGGSLPIGTAPGGSSATLGPGGLDGTWTIDQTVGSFSDFSDSFVGYRVNETLADNKANTAVGRTAQVNGSLVLAGASISSVDVIANLQRLSSDDDRRDGRLHEQAIETDRFPTSEFKLTTPIDLGTAPVDGQTITATATGELTLHGVTKAVQVAITARLSGDVVTVAGSIDIVFADYGIERPTSFLVLSTEDHGVMEFQLHFRHA